MLDQKTLEASSSQKLDKAVIKHSSLLLRNVNYTQLRPNVI